MPQEVDDNVENVEQADTGSDIMDMSDEDFLNTNEADYSAEAEPAEEEEEEESEDTETETSGNDDTEADGQQEETPEPTEEEEQPDNSDSTEPSNDVETTDETIDYKAEFDRLFGPIKAGGKTIKMKNVDQIINRIQMGEDYFNKMHEMRPHTKVLRTLEKAGILGKEDDINFMLDLYSKKPDAIRKLIADSKIDIVDLADDEQLEQSKQYKPDNHLLSDNEVAVSEAIHSISQSEKYKETMDIMFDKFDPKSREIISDNPDFIKSLNSDIETGIYSQVMDEVNYGREMGYIPRGTSDIEAYIGTVRQLAEQESNDSSTQNQPARQPVNAAKRKAMSTPRGGSEKKKKQFNPMDVLDMSDEQFEKQFGASLL